ncbi:MAG TPA: hypothetical protein VLB00_03240 [Gemmatimonadales bacterium]|nr:hypothetical protein [Gemmatimonadales bacterium]
MQKRRWTALAVASALAALLVAPAGAQSVDVKPTQKVKRDKYVLTAEEIAERPDITNAYDAVKLLRSQFLKATRAKGGITGNYAGGGYRPDAVGKPVSMSGGSSTGSSTGGSTGEPKPEGGLSPGGSSGDKSSEYGSASGGNNSVIAVLYIDDVKQTEIEEMKNVPAPSVVEIRYLTGNQAAGRYGAGHEGGAILLKTNRLGKKN